MVFPGGYFNFHNELGEYTSAQAEVNGQKMCIHLLVAEYDGTIWSICFFFFSTPLFKFTKESKKEKKMNQTSIIIKLWKGH